VIRYVDYSNERAPDRTIKDEAELRGLLGEARRQSPPGMGELVHDNGFKLLVGIAERGCIQHSPANDDVPYLMAVIADPLTGCDMEFMFDGELTEIPGNYAIPFDALEEIAVHFFRTGERSEDVDWEEI